MPAPPQSVASLLFLLSVLFSIFCFVPPQLRATAAEWGQREFSSAELWVHPFMFLCNSISYRTPFIRAIYLFQVTFHPLCLNDVQRSIWDCISEVFWLILIKRPCSVLLPKHTWRGTPSSRSDIVTLVSDASTRLLFTVQKLPPLKNEPTCGCFGCQGEQIVSDTMMHLVFSRSLA